MFSLNAEGFVIYCSCKKKRHIPEKKEKVAKIHKAKQNKTILMNRHKSAKQNPNE
jgi:hypothetical protein